MKVTIWLKILISLITFAFIIGLYFTYEKPVFDADIKWILRMQNKYDPSSNGLWDFFQNLSVFSIDNGTIAFSMIS